MISRKLYEILAVEKQRDTVSEILQLNQEIELQRESLFADEED